MAAISCGITKLVTVGESSAHFSRRKLSTLLIEDMVDRVPGKIGVFCRCDMREAESLFFQHYALVKQDERSRTAARPAAIVES